MSMMQRAEYPRPDFARSRWISLNGEWDFSFQESAVTSGCFERKILVPFAYQTPMSGIGDCEYHGKMYYRKFFDMELSRERWFLHFGAVDYKAAVFLNGVELGRHEGGYTPFQFEVSDILRSRENELLVIVEDTDDTAQSRGKQYWKEQPDRCWYVPTSGIWQSVWLEAAKGRTIEYAYITPDIDHSRIELELGIEKYLPGDKVQMEIFYNDRTVQVWQSAMMGQRRKFAVSLLEEDAIDEVHYWSPEHPNLYDYKLTLLSEEGVEDCVAGYFGMRSISVENGRIMLNHHPYYLKMVLDQGYWRQSGLTAPSDEAFREDIALCLQYGFNGARKHQKIEDPRYYYWCDKMGLLVWGELPSAYEFCQKEIQNLTTELQEFMKRDYNHPCLIAWVPLNESWGVRKMKTDVCQQHFGESLYHLCKAFDPMRLVSTNDGWENVTGDILGIHDYTSEGKELLNKYTPEQMAHLEDFYPGHRKLLAKGYDRGNMAVMMTEYGGIALRRDAIDGAWGYADAVNSPQMLIERYEALTNAIKAIPQICGYCYTQLTDVYQEVNGLLDSDHQIKIPVEPIRKINLSQKT